MSRVRLFAVAGVAVAGLGALKTLDAADDAAAWFALEAPAYASSSSEASHGEGEPDEHTAEGTSAHGPEADAEASVSAAVEETVCRAPTIAERAGLSHSEIRVLESLADRRAALDDREGELTTRAALLTAADARLGERVDELRVLRDEVEDLLGHLDEREEEQIASLVSTFDQMRAAEAAIIFTDLEEDILVDVSARMNSEQLAKVLAAMPAANAVRLTVLLARRHQTPDDIVERLTAQMTAASE